MKKSELNPIGRKFDQASKSIMSKAGKVVEMSIALLLVHVSDGSLNLQDEDCGSIYGFFIDDKMIGEQELCIRSIRLYEGCLIVYDTRHRLNGVLYR